MLIMGQLMTLNYGEPVSPAAYGDAMRFLESKEIIKRQGENFYFHGEPSDLDFQKSCKAVMLIPIYDKKELEI